MLSEFADWLLELLLWVPAKLLELLSEAVPAILDAIPFPDDLPGVSGAFSAIPPGVWWWLNIAEVPTGLAIIGGSLLTRFILRALPFVF